MKIQFLVSTIDRDNIDFLEKIFKNLKGQSFDVIVINQCINIDLPKNDLSKENIKVISSKTKGTSVSRNIALKNATGDICTFTDDDLVYERNAIEKVRKAFEEEKTDIITFKTGILNSDAPYKKYKKYPFKHSIKSILSVGDCEIFFKLSSIRKNKIFFDERFGLNCIYPACEYQIFLTDCHKNKLRSLYVPEVVVRHPDTITTGIKFEPSLEIARGAGFARMLGALAFVAILFFSIKKHRLYKEKHNLRTEILLLTKGALQILFKI